MEFAWGLSYNPRPVPNLFAVFPTGGSVVKIHEYQAKAILKRFGVPVPEGDVAHSPDEARAIAEKLGVSINFPGSYILQVQARNNVTV